MSSAPTETALLLQRLHLGDAQALGRIVERDLPWLRAQVDKRLGPLLRARGDSDDYLHDVVVQVLCHGPRFVVSSREHFRRLLLRIVEHSLRDRAAFHLAEKRDARHEVPWPSDTALGLDLPAASVSRPSEAASRSESVAWVSLGLALLDPEESKLILWRQQDGLDFEQIGARLAIEAATARKRFQRALQRLADRLVELRSGRVGEALDASESGP